MVDLNEDFLKRLVRAAGHSGRDYERNSPNDLKELQAYAKELIENPDDPETARILELIDEDRTPVETKIINPGFRPKMWSSDE